MATLYGLGCCEGITAYMLSKRRKYSWEQWERIKMGLCLSKTIYIGNQSFFTTEEQIYALFNMIGPVNRVIMGLHAITKEPCGFSFVEFHTHEHARDAVNYLNGLRLDSRPVKIDIDLGFEDGRQFGRGRAGGQVRDEFREDYDYCRGGWGVMKQAAIEERGEVEQVVIRPQPNIATVDMQDFTNENERFRSGGSDDEAE